MNLKDLLDNPSIQGLLIEGEKAIIDLGLDAIEAAVKRSKTSADNELFAAALEEAAKRVRGTSETVG